MNPMSDERKIRDYLKRAIADAQQARRRVRELEEKHREPIAIVGMACRFPGGVRSPDDLWRLLAAEGDAVSGFPGDRGWDVAGLYDPDPDRSGTTYVREGGFVHDVAGFDAGFFGISPREALAMDPQQRLLLESSWHAFEDAGIDPATLRGGRTGVFVGNGGEDYTSTLTGPPEGAEGYLLTGAATSVVSGRIAYLFGFEGPAVTVDTACSSSLVALHLAAQSLRQDECSLALAGGVTVMSSPSTFVEFSRQRGLAPDGRCKPFAAAADGTGWGEGVAVLLLEKLSDAHRNNHRVLGVVRGSAVNQDGASNGLTAPSGPAQERVIRAALASAQLSTVDVDAVEAHGTGTKLGDPIEAEALLATYGRNRAPERPLRGGSVKSNLGHTQAAAGVAGVIKMVLAMRYGLLPRTLHVDAPTPEVDWSAGAVSLLTEAAAWPETGRPRRAGVSSFGISGTNAHVILEQGVPDAAEEEQERPLSPVPWLLSAKSEAALRAQAAELRARFEEAPSHPADVGFSLATTRSAFTHRAAVIATEPEGFLRNLDALANGGSAPGLLRDTARAGKLAVLFSGQGSQRVGMGRQLAAGLPVFAEALDEVLQRLEPLVDGSLREVIFGETEPGLLDRTGYAQPALFALEVALFEQFQAWGVRPDFVAGHSLGEVTAAYVAGVFSLDDACTLVAARGRLMQNLPAGGAMLAVQAAEEDVRASLAGHEELAGIAAVNGPSSVVVSGDAGVLGELERQYREAGRKVRKLRVSHAFHSPLMDPMLTEFGEVLRKVSFASPAIPLISNVTGEPVDATTPEYWVDHVRRPVRFGAGVRWLTGRDVGTFLELGPDGTLAAMAGENAPESTAVAALRPDRDERESLLRALSRLHLHGTAVDWAAVFAPENPRRVELPGYPFEHTRFWLPSARPDEEREAEGTVVLAGGAGLVRTGRSSGTPFEYVLPALAAEAGEAVGCPVVAELAVREPVSPDDVEFQLTAGAADEAGKRPLVVHVRSGSAEWTHYADGVLEQANVPEPRRGGDEPITEVDVPGAAAGLDPALLETVLPAVPVSWRGLRLHQPGAAVTRARLGQVGDGEFSLLLSDSSDAPVATVDSVSVRENQPGDTRDLYRVDLVPAPVAAGATPAKWAELGDDDLTALETVPDVVVWSPAGAEPGEAAQQTLELVRAWLADERWASARLVVTTTGSALTAATAGGLLRSAQAEHPGRFVLADLDGKPESRRALRAAVDQDEPHLVIRDGQVRVPRLVRVRAAEPAPLSWDTEGTVLVTGGTGGLGALVARHLVTEHGVRRLLLLSRAGSRAEGANALVGELSALGADVRVAACDVADRDALVAVLDAIPAEFPLTAVVHTAGVIDDGLVESLDADSLARVLRPKVDGGWNLHELTRDLPLSAFVLFSSAAGVFGGPGQANYAAANSFLDALARYRTELGLPAVSLAWGLWAERTGLTGHLGGTDLRRIDRGGGGALSTRRGLALFDLGTSLGEPALVAARLALGGQAVPSPLLRGLVPAPDRPATTTTSAGGPIDGLAEMPAAERDRVLLDLVREQAAAVLGHGSAAAVGPDRSFRELGFDSLTAVELRNGLATATGLSLPATLAFDYPSPAELAARLRALLVGETAAGQLAPAVADAGEPIAIVGMSCRFPGGVANPDDLWRLLAEGRDAMAEFPADRGWDVSELFDPDPERPGKSYVREGAFLDDAAGFDAEFFGISPREALAMDPQQRLLLETSWEAVESAGIDPASLRGSATGVFAGTNGEDYTSTLLNSAEEVDGYLLTGNAASVLSGRVAYTFGLVGPVLTVDTACSSSLVALHLAAQALRQGECSLALAGGVTVMTTPAGFVEFSRQRGLAADGRCKPFANAADGTGWGEGAGVLVLERLSEARRNGHPVLAVVRGSAVNSDGASNGLTAPNGPSQERVIRQALANAGLSTVDVDAVEAHGTGTTLGDPIEAQALLATYGQDRERPLALGSIKSNLGHTQAAAGVAGMIKMVLALRHGTLPRTLHVDEPTAKVDWASGAVSLLTAPLPWPSGDRPRRAGVSSFGVSGTNAHVIVEEAPASDAAPEPVRVAPIVAWPVAARSAEALRAQAGRLSAFLDEHPGLPEADVGYSLATSRTQFDHRAVLVGDGERLRAGLRALAGAGTAPGLVEGVAPGEADVAFVFPGQGSQWTGMAVDLLDAAPVFAEAMAECATALSAHVDWNLFDVIRDDVALTRVDVVQPALFAVMVSLARLWESAGVRPSAVLGHSQGEIAAACVAGALSLPDAAAVVALRSKALAALSGQGGMVSVSLGEDGIQRYLDLWGDRLALAAINGSGAVVVSGDPEALDGLQVACAADEVRTKRIPVDYASHSAQVSAVEAELDRVLADLTPRPVRVPWYSTVDEQWLRGDEADAAYWYRNLRQTVRFGPAVEALLASRNTFVEISPHPVLTVAVQDTVERAGAAAVALGTLRRDEGGFERFLTSLAEAHVHGVPVRWADLFDGARRIDLPTYAFQHKRFWADTPANVSGNVSSAGLDAVGHPLLGAAVRVADGDGVLLTGRLSLRTHPWLADHAVLGTALLPGTAFLELAVRAGDEVGCGLVEELTLHTPLPIADGEAVQIQVAVSGAGESGRREVTVHSRPEAGDAPWTPHAEGTLAPADSEDAAPELTAWPPDGAVPVPVSGLHGELAETGLDYGPAFRGLQRVWRRGEVMFAEVELPEAQRADAGRFGLHPALLDAALHPVALAGWQGDGFEGLPFSWSGFRLHAAGAPVLRVRLSPVDSGGVAVVVADQRGALVATAESLVLRPVSPGQLRAAKPLYRLDWRSLEPPAELPGEKPVVYEVPDAGAEPIAGVRLVTGAVLSRVQEWLADGEGKLLVVTRGAVVLDGEVPDPAAAAVWGLVRSAQSENPDRFVLADVHGDLDGDLDDLLIRMTAVDEPQFAVRDGQIRVPRLVRAETGSALVPPADTKTWRVEIGEQGTLDELHLAESPEAKAPLAAGQVRIAVRAAGLNFRDVLIALGMYPDKAMVGAEGAGVVLEVGPGVDGLAPGDRVMGLLTGAFGPFAVADHRMLVPIPDGWSDTTAASVPVVFLTAYYALVDLAGLRAGEKVLIHAAAGGVGMAAVQLARHLGAEVFGTAGPAKHGTLRELGLGDEAIASSRSLEFEDSIRDATNGAGVDVVLNSLAGEFIDASLRLLPRGGRFVEMGKTDLRDDGDVADAHPGVRYQAFELGDAGGDRIQRMLVDLVALFEQGVLSPLPVRTWDVRRAVDAFRFVSQARHIGKIVLTVPAGPGTVLITGGTGGLGAHVARHLVTAHGVRRLVLASRSGPAAEGAGELVAELAELGARARVVACDVGDRDALAGVLASIPAEHPLTGVVHSAGALDDGVVGAMNERRFDTVLRPKADGAWHLHELTEGMPLSMFVLFSSASGLLGGQGQANYAAANAFLDALAARRRDAGLPGLSLAWGRWAERTGLTANLVDTDAHRMASAGTAALSTSDGLALFDAALVRDEPLLVPIPLDLTGAAGRVPALLRELAGAPARRVVEAADTDGAGGVALAERLAGLPPSEQDRLVLELVRAQAATVLGHATTEAVGAHRPFKELGFDSLTAVELRNRLTAATGLRLPATVVFDQPKPAVLAEHLREQLTGTGSSPVDTLLGELDRLEELLASVSATEAERGQLAVRLQSLAVGWSGQPGAEATRYRDGSDDELFDFIDKDLGVS
ncbi:SDR family NAD(P)-dependent oxidoreductase [Amycolatopsis lurida]